MKEAVALAGRGSGEVEPNPLVGALVVRDGRVVGRGHHPYYGGPHAEIVALQEAGDLARGATLYVTLEPCSTSGKTPACTEAVPRAGVRRVVFGVIDPSPRHAGRGLEVLRARGVEVSGPTGQEFVEPLLARFRRHLASARPYVIAKWAMTLDGKVATRSGDSHWISGRQSRALVHRLRGRVDGVLVGRGTVEADDPRLTARRGGPMTAKRIVLDRLLRLPPSWGALHDGGPAVVIIHGQQAPPERREELLRLGAELISAEEQGDAGFLRAALCALRARRVERLLVEAGPRLLGSFVDARCVDQVLVFVGTEVLGGALAPGPVGGTGAQFIGGGLALEGGGWDLSGEDAVFHGFVRAD
ncbi:MAG: bifunctional diaminohydroxyphosphoribosylaminopyrimidine deaminase/5-amino-6-(5-phosphoribosylamino)uracil reductase RibD [Planctomycetes bacterium]|nr:bifunctional diaminohydroxyphosphoribosylaminopyrimidine deaminase/5-amino-6-(5-phosphoribosylamino)uracil reductase RibD [Planctomycetota bacterium]